MIRHAVAVALLVASPLLAAAQSPTSAPAPRDTTPLVLRAARLIDGTGAPAVRNGVVVVRGERIVAVGAEGRVAIPAGARTIDLGDATLLPGFVDAHTHITGRVLGDPRRDMAAVRDFEGVEAVLSVPNAERTVMAGFTSIRNVGAPRFDDLALRQAIEEGKVRGPRMQAAGHSLGITGGHCDDNGWRPGLMDRDPRQGIADGPAEIRAAVRYQIKYGADVIKTCATGGVLSEGDAVGVTQYGDGRCARWSTRPRGTTGRSPRTPTGPRGSRSPRAPASRRSSTARSSTRRGRGSWRSAARGSCRR
jgi:imidazolonepropionase-like amidohydrolase